MLRLSALAGAALSVLAAPAFAQPAAEAPASALSPASVTTGFLKGIQDWTPLFDGSTLTGWTGEGYKVEDGAIVCTPEGRFLRTEKEYADYVLEFEFKLKPGSNNGIGIRYPGTGDAAYVGMEIQILDDRDKQYHNDKFELGPAQYHGSVYGLSASTQKEKNNLKPVGEWNHEIIVVMGDHIKVILNGETINDAYLSKLNPVDHKDHPGKDRTTGYIAFCGHGDYVAYKNLRIKEFSPAAPALKNNPDNTAPAGFTALFNGTDFTNWQGLAAAPNDNPFKRAALSEADLAKVMAAANESMKTHWTVVDGALQFDGKGASLATAKKYGDFDFYVDWKIPAKADSGIYLRGTPQVQIWDPSDPGQFPNGNQKGSGGLWNNKGAGKNPLVLADKPLGEWNTFHIRMIGDLTTIWLNGQLVVDRAPLDNYWAPGKPLPREEQIELQNHGNTLWFKNIYVRELPR